MKQLYTRQRLAFYLLGLVITVLCGGVGRAALARADSAGTAVPAWAVPPTTALRRVSPVDSSQHEPNFLNNLDCTLLTFHYSDSTTMESGCFTATAFGLMDSDTDTVIFNGTDEGVRLQAYSAGEVLEPWPQALNLVTLDSVNTGGSYINLYRNPLANLQDRRDALGKLIAKQLTVPPDMPLRDNNGQPVIVNPQTMVFSGNGSWLVAETLSGSFIRINLATLEITAFAPAFGAQGSPALLKSAVAVSDDGQYVAIANKAAGSLLVYDLTGCGSAFPAGSPSYSCPVHDYAPFAAQHISGFQAVRHMRFVNEDLLSFEAQTGEPVSGGVYELAPTGTISSLIDYLGLGDSYTAGEGAFDYVDGTDTADNVCHLSAHSYPLLLSNGLFSIVGGHSVACSGAVMNDVSSTSPTYRGQMKGVGSLQQLQQSQPALLNSVMANYLPGYVAQQRFVQQYQPGVMTVSVGGNDIGFGDIIRKCVLPHVSLRPGSNDCYNTYEDRQELTRLIDRTVPRWTALYKQLAAEAPGSRLYAIGYPDAVYDSDNCALNVHLSRNELEFVEELTAYLNDSIRQAADQAGVTYVDIGNALAGHRLCEAASYDVAVNGLTAGNDAGILGLKFFGRESYHPNALGQALMEQAILTQTNNLSSSPAIGGYNPDGSNLLNVSKAGRTIYSLVPDDNLTAATGQAGKSMTIQAEGLKDGLKPNTVYSVRLDGSGGPVLGTASSDTNGTVTAIVTLPGNTVDGIHTIDITGQNQAGEPVDVTQPIYMPVNDTDADGDGVPDMSDSCPGAADSGQDSDRDGIDDSCDPLISTPDSPPAKGAIVGPAMLVGSTISTGEPL